MDSTRWSYLHQVKIFLDRWLWPQNISPMAGWLLSYYLLMLPWQVSFQGNFFKLTLVFVIGDESVSGVDPLLQEPGQVLEGLVVVALHRLVQWRPGRTQAVDGTEKGKKSWKLHQKFYYWVKWHRLEWQCHNREVLSSNTPGTMAFFSSFFYQRKSVLNQVRERCIFAPFSYNNLSCVTWGKA